TIIGCSRSVSGDEASDESFSREIKVLDSDIPEITELVIVGGCSDYHVIRSEDENLRINAEIVVWKGEEEIRKQKLDMLNIIVKYPKKGCIMLDESIKGDEEKCYYSYLNENQMNGETKIHYDIQIPSSIQLVKLYTNIGNINAQDICAKFDFRTLLGNIDCQNIIPIENCIFAEKYGYVNIEFNSLEKAGTIVAAADRKLTLHYPEQENYSEQPLQDIAFLQFEQLNQLSVSERINEMKKLADKETEDIDFTTEKKMILIHEGTY
ncbi:MAG: hypothetical protein K2M91_10640, partial [Lachnospiraceae bacterium]|nr:hypothetical protein [Lachnospiraceae bacterium]